MVRRTTTKVGYTRNKVAATFGIISAVLFIVSGYNSNIGIYRAIESGLQQYTAKEIWQIAIIPVNILGLVAQVGGFAVMAGALLFLKSHITSGKLLVMVGTGQGIITIAVGLIIELLQGGIVYANNYVLWLATSAVGLGIVFSIVARSIAKPAPSNVRG